MRIIIGDKDKEIKLNKSQSCLTIFSEVFGKSVKNIVAYKYNDKIFDLLDEVTPDIEKIEPVFINSKEGLEILRHSTAHVMAQAVKRIFPSVKIAIGPAIENGFYYDFDFERSFTPQDLEIIEQEMKNIVQADFVFKKEILSKKEAIKLFLRLNESYKLELLNEIEDEQVSIYRQGDFVDLCRGPHVPSTGYIKAFKLTSVAGAYWRGDETKPMLQRIYGTSWPTEKELRKYLNNLEEAQKRDHRRLGSELDLFSFSDKAGPGLPLFHPKGALIRTILEDFEIKEHLRRGYQLVRGPQLLRVELWQQSGHYDNYKENMYFTKIDDQEYGIKPMNCLAHMLIYKSKIRSYRDLPIRYFELGKVNRHEKSGVLHGLLRVREFTQDDAHIICRPDQLEDEIVAIIKFVQDIMNLFGFDYEVEISTRPDKSIGSDEDWDRAINILQGSLEKLGLDYDVCPGEGAFYGPKIDIKLKDALNRKWQCATIQCDFTLPQRFDLNYIDVDGQKKRPVMLHRVILGAIERFMGILIEHYKGAFPLWLSPTQVRILTITDRHNKFAEEVYNYLRKEGFRVEKDLRNEKLGLKVREAQIEKIPYFLIIGDKELESRKVNVRRRGGKILGQMFLEEIRDMLKNECEEPFKNGGMSYSFYY